VKPRPSIPGGKPALEDIQALGRDLFERAPHAGDEETLDRVFVQMQGADTLPLTLRRREDVPEKGRTNGSSVMAVT
jgi:hypothetical protein